MTVIGTLIGGRFRLEEEVGSGGMSTVYRAFDPTLERHVAIKLMHRDISNDADQLERFRREARAVAQLNHPHVVTVIDAGEDDGNPFIVFEYVEGETLKDRIRRLGRLPVAEAVAYAVEIARALECAHSHMLVHRDVKPQNVLIDPDGRAKVTDFGIARSLEAQGLTATGRVLGTTDYVSPEQALGHEVTAQSDIYSLGIVLYEMLTGEAPFQADTQVAVAMKHVREPLPGRAASPPRDLRRAGRRRRARHREGDEEPLRHDRRDGARPRGGPGDRGRPHGPRHRRGNHGAALAVRRHRRLRAPAPAPSAPDLLPEHRAARHLRRDGRLLRDAHREGAGPGRHPAHTQPVRGHAVRATPPTTTTPRATTTSRAARSGSRSTAPPTTAWDTETYQGGFEANNKSGVGLYVNAGSPHRGAPDGRAERNARLQGRDLRLEHRPAGHRRLEEGERHAHRQAGAAVPARHGRQALPQLPALDHRAAGGRQGDREVARARRSS